MQSLFAHLSRPAERGKSTRHHWLACALDLRFLRLLFAGALSLPALASAENYYVGSGGGCYLTLGSALLAAASDPEAEIRLTDNVVHSTDLLLVNRSVVIRGGYAGCHAAIPTPGSVSQILSDDSSALLIDGAAGERRQVLIENVEFSGSFYWNGDGVPPPGVTGGIRVRGPVDVVMRGGGFRSVHSQLPGGAIRMQSLVAGIPELRLEDAVIEQASSSDRGGAISCQAGTLHVRRSRIAEAAAYQDGGGAIHASGCSVHLDDSVLEDNYGVGGGAIWLEGGVPSPTRLLANRSLLFHNRALSSGGGFLAKGAEVYLDNVKLVGNYSSNGDAFTAVESLLMMGGRACTSSEAALPRKSACSAVAGHNLRANGTVIRLANASIAQLAQTTLTQNHSSHAGAILIFSTTNSVLLLQNSVLTANSGLKNLINFTGDGQLLRLDHVSIHGNALQPDSTHIVVDDPGVANFLMLNSIFEGGSRGFPLLSGVASPDFRCMVTDEALAASQGERLTTDPGIAADGIHLRPDSVAIDFCPAGLLGDIDGDDRPLDDPATPNANPDRIADAGADEYVLLPDEVYASGFER